MTPIILPTADQVTDAMRPVITVGGLIDMIADLVAAGTTPAWILLHPMDAATVIEELNDHGTAPDKAVIGVIQGVLIGANEQVTRGSARVVPKVVMQ